MARPFVSLLLPAAALFVRVGCCTSAVESPKGTAAAHIPEPLTFSILSVENATGDPGLDFWRGELFDLLHDSLGETRSLCVKYLGDFEKMGPTSARTDGEWIEVRRVAWGSYRREQGDWVATFYIENVATGEVSKPLAARSGDWFEVRDRLIEQILKYLRVTPSAAERRAMQWRCTGSSQALTLLAKLQAMDGALEPRLAVARQAVKADPESSKTHERLAGVLVSMGHMEEAVTEARTAIRLNPDYGMAHYALGYCYDEEGKPDAALKELSLAARLNPGSARAWEHLGAAYAAGNQFGKALASYQRALELEPCETEIYACMSSLYAHEGKRQLAFEEVKQTTAIARLYHGFTGWGTESALWSTYDALHEVPLAIYHLSCFLKLAKAEGLDPGLVAQYANNLRELQATESPTFVRSEPPRDYTAEEFELAIRKSLGVKEARGLSDPMTSNSEMKAWALKVTAGATSELQKARALFDALTQHVQGGHGSVRTAAEAFAAWHKSGQTLFCHEYAYLYIALARAVGLKAFDVLVDEDCEGNRQLHACAAVFLGREALLVDPAFAWFGAPHKKFRIIDDIQSTAIHLSEQNTLRDELIAAKLNPNAVLVQANLAIGLGDAGRWDEAEQALNKLARLAPEAWLTRYVEAIWAVHQEKLDDAIKHLHQALAINPEDGLSRALLGSVYEKLGKLRQARDSYRAAVNCTLLPESPQELRRKIAKLDEKLADEEKAADATSHQEAK